MRNFRLFAKLVEPVADSSNKIDLCVNFSEHNKSIPPVLKEIRQFEFQYSNAILQYICLVVFGKYSMPCDLNK